MDFLDAIKAEIKRRRRPFLVCTCGNFEPGIRDEGRKLTQCRKCKGWQSDQQKEES